MKQFNRENCANVVRRDSITNRFGDKATLMGRYAYEWTVVITPVYGPTKCFTFHEGRKAALKYFNMIKKAYKNSNK